LEFLLLRASDHATWGFPKGRVDPGEGETEGARREFREETGLAAPDPVSGFREVVRYRVRWKGEDRAKKAVYFLAEAGEGDVRLSEEHDDFAWLPPARALERLPFENLREVLARAVLNRWRAGDPALRPFPSREPLVADEAERFLFSVGSRRDAWVLHSEKVGAVARRIGTLLVQAGDVLDPDFLLSAGMLHDVGRALDHDRHGLEGFGLLCDFGLPRTARISMTHWLKGRNAAEMKEDGFPEDPRLAEVASPERFRPLTPEEVVISVADGLVAGDRVVTFGERFERARKRYGDTPWIARNEALSIAWFEELEKKIGEPLLPLLKE
jgi:8-oxo-dGTP pyrophosphatase MutT (NUDIX family)